MTDKLKIISLNITNATFKQTLNDVIDLGLSHKPSFVCFANVHMTVEAHMDTSFAKDLSYATIITADGKPIAKACKWLYNKKQERIAGMDFMPALIAELNNCSGRIFLYGSTEAALQKIIEVINNKYPNVQVVGHMSPPFRQLSIEEEKHNANIINNSKAQFVFVALGCPKQEKWMARNYININATLLGVGGAFPVFAGLQKRAPHWMQKLSLEWFYRLVQEPKRLFRRYFYTNLRFIVLFVSFFFSEKK